MPHKLLERQIKKFLSGIRPKLRGKVRRAVDEFLNAVDQAYIASDEDRAILERAMTISSQELFESFAERKRLQNEVAENQANLVNAAKMSELGRMASGIAHEINSPLAVIKTHAGLIKDILGDESPDLSEATRLLEQIDEVASRIAKIISGLRTFSREGGSDPFLPTNLQRLIDETLLFCHGETSKNNIHLSVRVPAGLEIKCRATQISQVILNVVNNSCDAIADRPDKWIRIEAAESGDFVEISVTDSGSGIEKRIRAQMFEPFFTTKELGKGSGLGLSISYGIAKIHGGELRYDEESPNTRFVVRLSKAPANESSKESKVA